MLTILRVSRNKILLQKRTSYEACKSTAWFRKLNFTLNVVRVEKHFVAFVTAFCLITSDAHCILCPLAHPFFSGLCDLGTCIYDVPWFLRACTPPAHALPSEAMAFVSLGWLARQVNKEDNNKTYTKDVSRVIHFAINTLVQSNTIYTNQMTQIDATYISIFKIMEPSVSK